MGARALDCQMTTTSLMKLFVFYEWANAITLIVRPDFFVLQLFSAPHPDNFAMARAVGFGSLFFGYGLLADGR